MVKLVGDKSVTGALRGVLGLVNVGVLISAIVMVGLFALSFTSPDFAGGHDQGPEMLAQRWSFFIMAAGFGLVSVILNQLRRMLAAVNHGEAFELANVRRLQMIGLALIGLELSSYVTVLLIAPFLEGGSDAKLDVDLRMWVAILVVFILAEVFRQGAQMREDARMTV